MSQAETPAPAPGPERVRLRRMMDLAKYGRFCCYCVCLKPDEADRARRVFRLARRVAREQ